MTVIPNPFAIHGDTRAMERLVSEGLLSPGQHSIKEIVAAWESYLKALKQLSKEADSERTASFIASTVTNIETHWLSTSKLKAVQWLLREVAA